MKMGAPSLLRVWQLGRMRYAPALRLQEQLVQKVKRARHAASASETAADVLLLVEHEPVYTTGIRTRDYSSAEEARLRALGADFERTNRGGLITFHGPGQLVAYPVLDLNRFGPQSTQCEPRSRRRALLGMKCYVHQLEQTVIDVCGRMGLKEACRSPHTGVWLGENKICAMGVNNSELVTSHGLALNCSTDLNWFGHIVPCGIVGKGVTSLSQELGRQVSVDEMAPVLMDAFQNNFDCQLVPEEAPDIDEDGQLMEERA